MRNKKDIYNNIKFRIITQDFKPGQKLTESDLMTEYEVGRTPLREIITELTREGLMRTFPRSGTYVTELDINELKHAIEIRVPLERLAGKLAVTNIDKSQMEKLEQILLDSMTEQTHEDTWHIERILYLDGCFHAGIYDATVNPKLQIILHELQSVCSRFWFSKLANKTEIKRQWADHRLLLDTLIAGDVQQMEELMELHVVKFIETLKDQMF